MARGERKQTNPSYGWFAMRRVAAAAFMKLCDLSDHATDSLWLVGNRRSDTL